MSDAALVGLFTLAGALGAAGIGVWQRIKDRQAEDRRRAEENEVRRRERVAAELANVRSEGAVVVARAQAYLTEIDPTHLVQEVEWAVMVGEEPRRLTRRADDLVTTWEALRDPLGVLAVQLPTKDGRDLAERFQVALQVIAYRCSAVLRNGAYWVNASQSSEAGAEEEAKGPAGRREARFRQLAARAAKEWTDVKALAKDLREALHEAG